MQIRKSKKRQITKGIELPKEGKIRTSDKKKESFKYLGKLEADTIK